jgi:hypothetical protein
MGLISKDYTFSSGATIVAAEHNTNFDTLYSLVNGNLNAANLASNAGIVDTQLAQISTAGKVSVTALTGTVPSANIRRAITLTITAPTDAPTVGDGAMYFTCPTELNGMNLVAVAASTIGAGTGVTVQIARGRRSAADGALTFADMLSTAITIDTGEYDSANAAAPAVIDTTKDDIVVSTYVDVLRIDVDVASGLGLEVRMAFQTP